jgi:hypothetical protein
MPNAGAVRELPSTTRTGTTKKTRAAASPAASAKRPETEKQIKRCARSKLAEEKA